MSEAELSCVVFGAGALGLGFLGPELTPLCRVTYVDIPAKADLLDALREAGSYRFNETGLSMRAVTVSGVHGIALGEGGAVPDELTSALDAADFIVTAVGERNLPKLAPMLAAAVGRRPSARPLRVLCSENGVEIAHKLRSAVEEAAGCALGDALLAGDTVMGRMCKVAPAADPLPAPPAPGLDWAVVAEPFFGIPVERHAVAGLSPLPPAVQAQSPEVFQASEDVKMLSHNGLHAVLAYVGELRGVGHFAGLRREADVMELGRRLLVDEAGRALLQKHGAALDRNAYWNYADSILRRITCPVLNDPIERGARDVMRKLEPWERLVYSVRTVHGQGIEPVGYATGLAAALLFAERTGASALDADGILTEHCGFDGDADAELLALIRDRHAALLGG
jgi:mannitol-1-phosphate 5-dehydrogenase